MQVEIQDREFMEALQAILIMKQFSQGKRLPLVERLNDSRVDAACLLVEEAKTTLLDFASRHCS